MNLQEILLGTGAVVAILIQGFKTIPFVKAHSWISFPLSLILGILCVMMFGSIGQPHLIFNAQVVWIGLSVGLIAGGYYGGTTSAANKVSSIIRPKNPAV